MNNSKTERALIAVDIRGTPVILATDGAWIGNDCENFTADAEELGIILPGKVPPRGLYLWTGTGTMVNHGAWDEPEELEPEYTGTLRPVLPEEIAELYAMEPPESPAC